MTVYWASVEFDIITPEEYENCIGGFVYLFFKASSEEDAAETVKKALAQEGLELTHIEFLCPYDETWESEEDQRMYDGLAKEARDGDEVVWDQIAAYESKED
jgi:hypothetical protein